MMSKFIIVFTEDEKDKLLNLGYEFFKESDIGNETGYVFLNNNSRERELFEKEEGKFLFTNKLFL